MRSAFEISMKRARKPRRAVRAVRGALLALLGELARADRRLDEIARHLPRPSAFPEDRESQDAELYATHLWSIIHEAEDSLATAIESLGRCAPLYPGVWS